MASTKIPKQIGRYQVAHELGRGGMGVVYLAQDPFIDRLVAIKTTLASPSKDPQKLEQFQQIFFNEARAAGKLMHPPHRIGIRRHSRKRYVLPGHGICRWAYLKSLLPGKNLATARNFGENHLPVRQGP